MAATQINSQSVNVLLAKKLQQNFWAGQIFLHDYGVNEGFSDNTDAATIRVVRQIAPGIKMRRYGATTNGAAGNTANVIYPTSEEFELNLTDTYDGNIDIPEIMTDMFPLGVVESEGDAIGGEFATGVNAQTIAEQFSVMLNAYTLNNTTANIVTMVQNATVTMYRDALLSAMSKLDNGDSAHGVQTFPAKNRQIVVRPDFKAGLFQANNILLGGSNLAQELLAKGRISENTYVGNGDLFIGEFMGVPITACPDSVWSAAWANLCVNNAGTVDTGNNITDVAAALTELNKVQALVVSSVGTLRGIAMGNRIKQIDSPTLVGIRLQPKMRMGVKCIYPKSVVPVVNYGFTAANIIAYTNATVYTFLSRVPDGSQS